ncbi:MAG: hypothetical protein OXU74_17095 [Gemmatimonadota bacterium]|nr:hypothetical protein [Gemmatimonadota bacterium]
MRPAALFVLALAALAATAPDLTAQSCGTMTLEKCVEHYWNTPGIMPDDQVKKWRIAIRNADWKTSTLCRRVKAAAVWIFSNNIGYESASDETPDVKVLAKYGENGNHDAQHAHAKASGGRGFVAFASYLDETTMWQKILQETSHHAGYGDAGGAEAEKCAKRDKKKEDDDDENDGGGNNGGGGTEWIPGETCTTSTEWVEKWRPCSSNGGGGGGSSCTWAVQYCTVPGVSACTEKYYELEEVVTCS